MIMRGFRTSLSSQNLRLISLILIFLALLSGIGMGLVSARETSTPETQASPLHPDFPFLDDEGMNVLDSGEPVSTINTCGSCHDAEFITQHSYHASIGLNDLLPPGQAASGRAWDISPGYFGSWNSIEYRYLSSPGDRRIDLTTPDWIKTYGIRHVGGGPAVYSQAGTRLTELNYQPDSLETNILDPETDQLIPWDWERSGTVEMNCFLCHIPDPNNQERIEQLQAGNFQWANTATILNLEVVNQVGDTLQWDPAAFTEEGEITQDLINIQDPTNENCGLCHGLVHDNVENPLVTYGCSPERWSTITTGQIISPQKLSDSGMNLKDKTDLARSWDIHAERLLDCTDCHYSLNNPLYYQESESTRPEHLLFDPRRVEIGDYLLRPLHQFARGNNPQSSVAPELTDTMRQCDGCHSVENSHSWLPYKDTHFAAVSCESCHIPKMYSSANMHHDWTVLMADGTAAQECRGVEGELGIGSLLSGYQPVLLPGLDPNGKTSLEPYNLITTWYWVYGSPPRPVPLQDLQAAYLQEDSYHPGIVARFDLNQDQQLDPSELIIDTPEKEAFVRVRLEHLGFNNPRIEGEIQPYDINHTVASGDWAIKDCRECHGQDSRITAPIQLSSYTPGGVLPRFIGGTDINFSGELYKDETGSLYYQPQTQAENLYVLGHDSSKWIDLFGSLLFGSILLGVLGHSSLRYFASRRITAEQQDKEKIERVYMYGVYERFWHWLQTFVVVLLLLTGLIIHKPDTFGIFSFRGVVLVHNTLAATLVINALLSLFYHLASGEIKQFIPRPRGFFDRSISQAVYYLQGIFQGRDHPFEKTPEQKLNPLQQITYFGLLNILLPLQILTGSLMWGVQHWPDLAARLGGLPFLAPFHTLIAWLFGSFTVMHVYLTTTGHTPLSNLKAMIFGWEVVEVNTSDQAQE